MKDEIQRLHTHDEFKDAETRARIESLEWALADYNMPDTDTKKNLEGYIAELEAQLKEKV